MGEKTRLRVRDYTVGWISALPVELAAALEMLDEEHSLPEDFPQDDRDDDFYTFGRIGSRNIVFSCLPAGLIGTTSAASVASRLTAKFRHMKFGLMVGIGGGVPSSSNDIRLGDVVVSTPSGSFGGVVQYDFGKAMSGGLFHRTGSLNAPPQLLLNALSHIRARQALGRHPVSEHLSVFNMLPTFSREKAGPDILYEGESPKARPQRNSTDPSIHYGTIATGNQVMKDSVVRDRLSQELNGVLCFEMEAAGLMNNFPCLVIRGICDYADSHKNKNWQPYAAATAAAYAKELLSILPAGNDESGEIVSLGAETSESIDSASGIMHNSSYQTGVNTVRSFSVPDNTVKEAEGVVGLPGGPRRGRPRKVRGEIKGSGKAPIQDALGRNTLTIDTDGECVSGKKEKENPHHQRKDDALSNIFKQPVPRKALFTLFDRATHVHFYREVYYGNGTLIRNVINNQRGNISSSGGSVNFGNVTGSMHSNNVQGARQYGTSAYNFIRHSLGTRPHLNWGNWGILRHLKSWIKTK